MKLRFMIITFCSLLLFTCFAEAQTEYWIIDTQTDWNNAKASANSISIANGMAEPTQNTASFQSVLKTFPQKRKAKNIIFKQSPVWDNWDQIADVTPSAAGNALVLLPIGDKDYYIFGNKSGDLAGYHAWHSTDMQTWTHCGRVTTSNWVTTAEYVPDRIITETSGGSLFSNTSSSVKISSLKQNSGGTFFIYYDKPNDEDPHLVTDRDLFDGQIGHDYGMVFNDPSHGSDCGIFRDEDGSFHLFYEDWDPINAKTHAWDSPLAGHSDSPDGITGFLPHEYPPPIDQRTTSTGQIGTYVHGTTKLTYEYEIHEPEQNAYGDYTMIKVGSQYYLFSDADIVGKTMRVAKWTGDNIYQQFDSIGTIGSGFHPDPSVGFAEGKFYLIIQTHNFDFSSPGPWVDKVEIRVGVDTDGDSNIDKWTTWQTISEKYSNKPGFARIVDVTPAQLNLAALPEGYNFKFEFKTTDTTSNSSKPIIDKITMSFQ